MTFFPSSISRSRSPSSSSQSSNEEPKSEQAPSQNPAKAVEEKQEETVTVLSDKEMNVLGAKLVKAEMMGNEVGNSYFLHSEVIIQMALN